MPLTRFDRYVDRHAASFVERLQALCRMPSVAARGTGMRAVAETITEAMQRAGGGTRQFKYEGGHPVVFGEFGAGRHCFLIYGHYDVQPVGALAEWTSGPFAAAIADNKLRARGASDSKGDLLARLVAIEAYQKSFGKLPVCLRFIAEGEDALGSPSLRRFVSEHADLVKADGCIWDDGYKDTRERLVTSLGFKGIAFLELRATGARTDVHSKWGGILPNPAWRLVQALATVRDEAGNIAVDGFAAHVAAPSADDVHAVRNIELDEVALRHEFRIKSWARGLTGRALAREYILGPTCTICSLDAGTQTPERKPSSPVAPSRA
jgi:acetylornithine deacetylase/succinyl-diaminopimelate desuccinylase-like protein